MQYRPRRIPADMRAAVLIAGRKKPVRVLDVSETGIKIGLAGCCDPGTPTVFLGLRSDLPGVIRWADGKAAGLQFDRALSPQEMGDLAGMVWGGRA